MEPANPAKPPIQYYEYLLTLQQTRYSNCAFFQYKGQSLTGRQRTQQFRSVDCSIMLAENLIKH